MTKMKHKTASFGDIPLLEAFSYGGRIFEKQSSQWAKPQTSDPSEPMVFFHRDDEVFDVVPVAWKDGKPIYPECER